MTILPVFSLGALGDLAVNPNPGLRFGFDLR
jgi:hypothetical protein